MNNTPDNNTNIPAGSNKRSSPLLKVLPIAVLAAVLVYFAAQVYNYFADPMTITLVYEAQAEDVISMEGWLVRTEEPLPGQAGTVSRAVQEGQRVAAGETVATVYSDDSALQTVSRIETLELQLQQLQFALTSYLDPDAALKLDTSITGDILTLRQTLSAGDYAAAESDLAALKAAVLKRDHGSYTSQEEIQAQIKSVESEIQQQKAALSGAKTVTAKASGTYSAVCDGYESVLTEAFLEDVTPSKLNGVKAAAEQSNVGKLIYGDTWYYAVVLPAEQAAALKDMGRVDVRLAKGFDQSIRMSVVSVSREENGQAAVVLSSTRYLAQTTLLRHQAADAVLHTYQGLRVPADTAAPTSSGRTRLRYERDKEAQAMSIRENLEAIRAEIDAAARETGRTGADITLVGASKMNDAAACQEAIAAGIDALGENRVQEMTAKLAEDAYRGAPLHFIGHLQRNKVKQVVGKVALIQSIGSPELLAEVDKQADKLGIVQDILLEVNIGGEAAKSGFAPQEVENAAAQAKKMGHVRVRGLMTIPPADATREENVVYFQKVQALYVDINRKMYDNGLEYLSMGMSGDFADAIRAGANMVRVGTAIFGARDYSK